MSDIRVIPVSVEYTHRWWPAAQRWMSEAEQHSDDYTLDQLKVDVVAGRSQLIMLMDGADDVGALVVEFLNYPGARVAFIQAYGGRQTTAPEVWADVARYLRARGASRCRGACRPSVARLLERIGFTHRYTIMEAAL
jgi:hypothetical protein